MSKTYTIRDLLAAVINEQITRGGLFPVVVDYYERQSKAFQDAFDMHFSVEEAHVKRDTNNWDDLFQATIESYLNLSTPFSGMLEIPRSYVALIEEFDQPFAERIGALRELHLSFLIVLCERWYGDKARRTITSSDLLSCKFDDSEPAQDILS